jgi:tRNA threonylcarbamoyladenosine biosynthesis protein TsaB
MILLVCDTSTKSLSVALCDGNKLMMQATLNTGMVHSRVLMPTIHNILEKADVSLKEIDCFGCTKGPGSFTGIRIGVCVIKGMAFALERPAAGVSTLATLAHPYMEQYDIIIPMVDARNRRVFSGYFKGNALPSSILPAEESRNAYDLVHQLDKVIRESCHPVRRILFCGDCTDIYKPDKEFNKILKRMQTDDLVETIHYKKSDPDAYHAAQIIHEWFLRDPDTFVKRFDPFLLAENYLIPSGAERIRKLADGSIHRESRIDKT